MRILITLLACLSFSAEAHAQHDGAFLDPLYKDLVHPKVIHSDNKGIFRSDVEEVIGQMTPVRSQMSRGTCSIFSAIAMLEGMLVIKKNFSTDTDLSEEYLEYLAVRNLTTDGSYSGKNFWLIARHGVPGEKTLPYIGDDWQKNPWMPLPKERCGHLQGERYKSCLIIHRDPKLLDMGDHEILDQTGTSFDPDFVRARREAAQFRNNYIQFSSSYFNVNYTNQIKELLRQGIPVTLGIEFFYGAWNHSKSLELGIGRDMDAWYAGIVGHPETGSVDIQTSRKNPAGHSILVVGYDDNKIIKTSVKMQDGSTKSFTYKGVYYFKNSWGSDSFGRDFAIDGVSYPGYGMITQKHAHTHGSFYHMPLR